MAYAYADRVRETTATTGTGSLTLGGAVSGFQSFASGIASGSQAYYVIDDGAGNWEVGSGTFTSPSTLTRTSVLASSNSNALVNFGAGTKTVFLSVPATFFANASNPSGSTDWRDAVDVVATANISLTGEQTIDGVLTSASDVLVIAQNTPSQNGWYTSAAGAWSRRATEPAGTGSASSGAVTAVLSGSTYAGTWFQLTTADPINLGVTALSFAQITLPGSVKPGKKVTGTSVTMGATDVGKRLNFSAAGAKTYTIAPNSSVKTSVDAEIEFYNDGAAALTLAPGSGVALNSQGGGLVIPQYCWARAKKRANPDTWDIDGPSLAYSAHVLFDNAASNLTKGMTETTVSNGTKSSGTFTPDCTAGYHQSATFNGALTLAPPTTGTGDAGDILLTVTNGASAGAITTSGFTRVDGAFDTTSGHKFKCFMTVDAVCSYLNIVAMQ